MTLSHARFLPAGLAGLILCLGCASAPAPAKPEPAAPSAAPPPPRVSLICHEGTTAARFTELGVPKGEYPEAAAISGDLTYVLFRPGRLLRIKRKEGKIQAEMALSKPGETWANLDVDPVDGSLWLVSDQDLALRQITPDWKTKTVKLQKVEGSGGFSRILAAPDALYVTPSCAEKGVWRISRDGKVLGTEFPAPPPPNPGAEPVNPDALTCSSVRLERDGAGKILAWDRKRKTLHRTDSEGKWTPVEEVSVQGLDEPFQETSVVKGIDVGGEGERPAPARDRHTALFERLAQRLERVPPELGQLVHEEDAAMRERDLARPDRVPAAEERRVRDRRVRRAEGPCDHERHAVEEARDTVDPRRFDRLVERERRQDRRQPAREHRLAGTRRSKQQQVVRPGGGDFERALRVRLAAHLGQVAAGRGAAGEEHRGVDGRRHDGRLVAQVRDGFGQCPDAEDGRAAGEGRFGRVRGGRDDADDGCAARRGRDRQRASDRVHAAVEAELADHAPAGEVGQRRLPFGGDQTERDREVERDPFLADARGGEIHGDATLRILEPGVAERGADAVARLAHGPVGQADGRRLR